MKRKIILTLTKYLLHFAVMSLWTEKRPTIRPVFEFCCNAVDYLHSFL